MSSNLQSPAAKARIGQRLDVKAHWVRSALASGPALLWLTIFLLGPLLIIVAISFFSRGAYGELELPLTFESYKRLTGFGAFGFDPVYLRIFFRSLALGASTTALCIAAGLPLAFCIAGLPRRYRHTALML